MPDKRDLRKKWLILSPLGLALIGFGASLLGYAVELKTTGAALLSWFVWGTVSLVVLNAGVAVFGEAVKTRILFELKDR